MALTKELKIHKDCCKLLHVVDVQVSNMDRYKKYNIGNRMFGYVLDMRECIGHANRTSGKERIDALNKLLEKNDSLDALANYCLEFKYLSLRQVSEMVGYIELIGKQATAWRNSTKE